jgi:lysophospholipase L1-like esterase
LLFVSGGFGRRLVRRCVFFACAITLAVSTAGVTSAAEKLLSRETTIRIMALGDSITAGIIGGGAPVTTGGYRGVLAQLLAKKGYHAVFVGTRDDYSAAIRDRSHEGWPGYVLRSYPSDPGPGQIYGPLVRSALRTDEPDVVLLMAGTNDLIREQRGSVGYTIENVINSMDLVLDEIFAERPNVRVIVAPVVASPIIDTCTLAHFNGDVTCGRPPARNLASLVASYAQRGYRITMATEMADAVPRDALHFPDGIHPGGEGGYAAIAGAWFDAIERVTVPPPAANPVARN